MLDIGDDWMIEWQDNSDANRTICSTGNGRSHHLDVKHKVPSCHILSCIHGLRKPGLRIAA